MSEEAKTPQQLLDDALAQADQARHYADFIKVVESSDIRVHTLLPIMKSQGYHAIERDGWIQVLIPGGAGNGQTWDGRDYRQRRLDAYKAEIPEGLTAEAINEKNEDPPRLEKWDQLQAIRQAIKERYPKPQSDVEPEGNDE